MKQCVNGSDLPEQLKEILLIKKLEKQQFVLGDAASNTTQAVLEDFDKKTFEPASLKDHCNRIQSDFKKGCVMMLYDSCYKM